jgi:MFS family permease
MKDAQNFWLYTVGRLVSLIGSGVQDVAIPLFILDVTGSGTIMGTFMIVTVAPRLILVPLAGVVGDRVNRKFIMVWMDFGRGALILGLAALAAQHLVTIPVLFFAQFAVSLMNALFGPATAAMLPDIVEKEELTRANSILGAVNSLSYIVGPALGGIIYAFGGIKAAFFINGISFAASGVSELFIQYEQKTKKFGKIKEVVTDLKEGLLFVKAHRGLLILLLFALVLNFLANPLFSVLTPYILRVVIQFSSEQFGLLQTSFVTGILIGNIIIGAVLAKASVEKMFIRGLLVQSVFMFVYAGLIFPYSIETLGYASWTLFFAFFLTFVAMGVFNAFVNTPIAVELQTLAPTEYRARVFSVLDVATQGIVPIGFGIMGILLDVAPAHVVAAVVVAIEFLIVLLFVFKYSKEVFYDFENNKNVEAG